ncbi:MAG: hypothetical protein HQ461_09445 [Deltaproteobacteria bacterium]|nr:hypothetical protein [Deltaproteobacteria bacterium]
MTKFDCTSCQDALADCLDAETQPTGDLAAHLAECTECAAAWSQLQQAWSVLRPQGLSLSAEAQARVLAYAAAHLPGAESRVEAAPSRPIGRWFWAAFALALALVVWKVGTVPEPTRAAPPETAKVAEVEPGPAVMREPLPRSEAAARSVALDEAAPANPSPSAEVAAVDDKPAPRAEEGIASPAASPSAAEQAPSSKAKAEMPNTDAESPKMAASAASRAPRVRSESQVEDALGGEAATRSDRVAGIAAAPDADEAPTVRAAAPAGRAAEREARAVAAAPVVAGGSQPSAAPSLDQTTRAAIDTLLRSAEPAAVGWSQLRSAAAASSLRGFEALLASCGADTRLCDGAALGTGALRAASKRADATPLLQRAARSEVGAVADAARRLLAGP